MRRALRADDFDRDNRRSEPRKRASRHIDVLPSRASADWKFIPCLMLDCSLHGIAVEAPQPLDVGHQFLVKLSLPRGVRLLTYTVRNCARSGDDRHRIGAQFSGVAAQEADEELSTVLAELASED